MFVACKFGNSIKVDKTSRLTPHIMCETHYANLLSLEQTTSERESH